MICHDCDARPGMLHMNSCDVERCPFCGGQALGCFSYIDDEDMARLTFEHLETQDPEILKVISDILENGGEVILATCCYEIVKESDRMPWSGEWPGKADCRKLGFWCKMGNNGWEECDKNDPKASEDLNRLYVDAKWDRKKRKFVSKEK